MGWRETLNSKNPGIDDKSDKSQFTDATVHASVTSVISFLENEKSTRDPHEPELSISNPPESGDTSDKRIEKGNPNPASVTSVITSGENENPIQPFFGTPAEAVALLNSVQARFWIDETGAGYIGVWSFLDGREVRAAAALICPTTPVIHLERPEVPMHLKWMSEKIARFAGSWGLGRIQ